MQTDNNSKSTNAEQPAFPFIAGDQTNPDDRAMCEGLTKREYFAAMAMQGMLANPLVNEIILKLDKRLAGVAIEHADELLEKLNEPLNE